VPCRSGLSTSSTRASSAPCWCSASCSDCFACALKLEGDEALRLALLALGVGGSSGLSPRTAVASTWRIRSESCQLAAV
jgi:hypothetical protein